MGTDALPEDGDVTVPAAKKPQPSTGSGDRALDAWLTKMEKSYGEGTFSTVGVPSYEVISTGSLTLDTKLSVGGYIRGRLYELWGPDGAGKTSLALIGCAQAQKAVPDRRVGYIDMEHRLDGKWAASLGVDISRMIQVRPNNAEEVADQLKDMLRSGLFSMVVVDSVGAMIPEKEMDKDAGESAMGKKAQVVTRMVQIAAVDADKSGTVVIFINQVRANFSYGCVHGETPVPFVDGSSALMRDVVRNKIHGEVWAWSESEGRFVPRPIVGWHDNGSLESNSWVHLTTDVIESRGGRHGFTLTPEHLVMTPDGWCRADALNVGDRVASTYRSVVNGDLHDFLWGTLSGDCHITSKGQLVMQDSVDPEYVAWKVEMLSPFSWSTQAVKGSRISHRSSWHHELRRIKGELGRRDPSVFLRDHYSLLGLAVWYMDDGWIEYNGTDTPRAAISVPRGDSAEVIDLLSGHGWEVTYTKGSVYFSRRSSMAFFRSIAHLVHPSMERKLPQSLRGRFFPFTLSHRVVQQRDWVTILRRQDGRNRDLRWPCDARKYDITVEGESNYLVGGVSNGVVVHNSDTTTPGGFALKHVTTGKMQVKQAGRSDALLKVKIDGEERVVGYHMAVAIQRNSVAPARRTAEFVLVTVPTLRYGPIGIDQADEAVTIGLSTGVIQRAGAWYTFGEHRVNGRDSLVSLVRAGGLASEIREHALAVVAADVTEENLDTAEGGDDGDDGEDASGPQFRKGAGGRD